MEDYVHIFSANFNASGLRLDKQVRLAKLYTLFNWMLREKIEVLEFDISNMIECAPKSINFSFLIVNFKLRWLGNIVSGDANWNSASGKVATRFSEKNFNC